ncbi:hypothetical protein POM88_014882 [Heracleum sosnowskyi]|uniref:Uncharacterized protein n=1 Tax=Heracleum sosnowskyi TaxID=360622 RepID=A0AAD8MVK8_9APIA|nr:hypothetical protein POM88_014882 [Heracleum sosnowskyi]
MHPSPCQISSSDKSAPHTTFNTMERPSREHLVLGLQRATSPLHGPSMHQPQMEDLTNLSYGYHAKKITVHIIRNIEDCLHGSSVPLFSFNLKSWPYILSKLNTIATLTDVGGIIMDAGDMEYKHNDIKRVDVRLIDNSKCGRNYITPISRSSFMLLVVDHSGNTKFTLQERELQQLTGR